MGVTKYTSARQMAVTAAAALCWAMALRDIEMLLAVTSMDPISPLIFSGAIDVVWLYAGFGLLAAHAFALWVVLPLCTYKILLPFLYPLGTVPDAVASALIIALILLGRRLAPKGSPVGA